MRDKRTPKDVCGEAMLAYALVFLSLSLQANSGELGLDAVNN